MTEGNQVILKEIDRRFEEAVKSLTDTPDKLSSTQLYVAVAEAWAQECLDGGMLATHQSIKTEIKRIRKQASDSTV